MEAAPERRAMLNTETLDPPGTPATCCVGGIRSDWIGRLGLFLLLFAIPLWLWRMLSDPVQTVPFALYLPFHSLVEVFAVVVAAMIFVTGWHVRDERRPAASVMLACAFLSVGLMDLAHFLSYEGMAAFITPNTPHKGIVFWLAARYAAALALLAYIAMSGNPRQGSLPMTLLAGSLALSATIFAVGIWHPHWVPSTFVTGQGLTPFKLFAESGVALIGLITLALFHRRRKALQGVCLPALGYALALMLASELFFMIYSHVTDMSNVVGHIYKVLAYLFLYRALFLDNVRTPIDRLRQARSVVSESERRHLALLETAPDAILVIDGAGSIQMVNERLEKMFGYSREELLGRNMDMLVPVKYRDKHRDHQRSYLDNPDFRPMAGKEDLAGRRKDGVELPVDISLSSFQCSEGVQITAFIRDVTDRRRIEADLRHRATHDSLTGLPNRALFQDRLAQAMVQAQRHQRLVAVILLDIDNFKSFNDGWGHNQGDQLIRELARRLCEVLRPDDTVARLGGDEFMLLLSDLGHMEDVGRVTEKIQQVFAKPFRIANSEVFANSSMGITLYPMDGDDVSTLIRNADVAMYRAKSEGRGGVRYFTRDLNTLMRENLLLQTRLRHAVEADELELHYQPKLNLKTNEISGVEALLRWSPEELGPISPSRFIPVAEANGLIIEIGAWALKTACRQISTWVLAGRPTKVAVNISVHQFRHQNIVEVIGNCLAATGAPASLLELELTESALMEDPEANAIVLAELERMGVTISIDDFGTGYSSMAYLKNLPIHKLKIDQTFIKDVVDDPKSAAIVCGLVTLAHSLGISVVAEGVEREAQKAFLIGCDCDEMQGWLLSKAVPPEQCMKIMLA